MKKLFFLSVIASLSVVSFALTGSHTWEPDDEYTFVDSVDVDLDLDAVAADSVVALDLFSNEYLNVDNFYLMQGRVNPLADVEEDIANGRWDKILRDVETVLKDLPGNAYTMLLKIAAYAGLEDLDNLQLTAKYLFLQYPDEESVENVLETSVLADRTKGRVIIDDIYSSLQHTDLQINESVAFENLGRIALTNGMLQRAWECFDHSNNEPIEIVGKALVYDFADCPEKAIEMLETLPERHRMKKGYKTLMIRFILHAKGLDAALDYIEDNIVLPYDLHDAQDAIVAVLMMSGKNDEVLAMLDGREDELNRRTLYRYACALKEAGKEKLAEVCFDFLMNEEDVGPEDGVYKYYSMAMMGRTDELREIIDEQSFDPQYKASLYVLLGENDKALDCLGEAFELGLWSPNAVKYDVIQRPLINHPRFAEITRRFHPDLKQ